MQHSLNVFVIGTRAQLIKVAPVIKFFEYKKTNIEILMTGQHKETMGDLFDEFFIQTKPIYVVEAAERSSIFSLFKWLPSAYLATRKKLLDIKKKHSAVNVLVHGDTLTTLISACCAKKNNCNVIHLESGLTSRNIFSPFPEEIIRRIVFKFTDIAFCPDASSKNYMDMASKALSINTNGNTIFDAIEMLIGDVGVSSSDKYIVVSIHRFDNIFSKKRMAHIVNSLIEISKQLRVYFVLHPATIKRLKIFNLYELLDSSENICLVKRMGYSDFIRKTVNSVCVITDGGSNQEELAYLGVPTVIFRQFTERVDGLGGNALMEAEINNIVEFFKNEEYENLKKIKRNRISPAPSEIIVNFLTER